MPFRARDAEEYENKDLVLYEEVALISGFQRPVICLIGADGVGRRSLRRMLVRSNPERYALPVLRESVLHCRYDRAVSTDSNKLGMTLS